MLNENTQKLSICYAIFAIEEGKRMEQIQCDNYLISGVYTVQVINLATKKMYSDRI
jgi:hypothetical protein